MDLKIAKLGLKLSTYRWDTLRIGKKRWYSYDFGNNIIHDLFHEYVCISGKIVLLVPFNQDEHIHQVVQTKVLKNVSCISRTSSLQEHH